ncbi:hypothetical protein V8D89_002110 [Ganoderma adspersum]
MVAATPIPSFHLICSAHRVALEPSPHHSLSAVVHRTSSVHHHHYHHHHNPYHPFSFRLPIFPLHFDFDFALCGASSFWAWISLACRAAPAFFTSSLQSCSSPSSHCVLSATSFSFFASGLHLLTSPASFTYCDSAMGSPPVYIVSRIAPRSRARPIPSHPIPSHFGLILPALSSTARAYGHKPGRANLLHPSVHAPISPCPRPYDTHMSIVRVQLQHTVVRLAQVYVYVYAAAVHADTGTGTYSLTHTHHRNANATLLFLLSHGYPSLLERKGYVHSMIDWARYCSIRDVGVDDGRHQYWHLSRHCVASICGPRAADRFADDSMTGLGSVTYGGENGER